MLIRFLLIFLSRGSRKGSVVVIDSSGLMSKFTLTNSGDENRTIGVDTFRYKKEGTTTCQNCLVLSLLGKFGVRT